jgi:hypothetical protein
MLFALLLSFAEKRFSLPLFTIVRAVAINIETFGIDLISLGNPTLPTVLLIYFVLAFYEAEKPSLRHILRR